MPALIRYKGTRDPKRSGAARGIRTPDPLITNEVLYQLSYCGEIRGVTLCGASDRCGFISVRSADGKALGVVFLMQLCHAGRLTVRGPSVPP